MILIKRASIDDFKAITDIGNISVKEAHKDSCPEKDLDEYMKSHYNEEALREELANTQNIYHILFYDEKPGGFSKMVLNAEHANIDETKVAKLDRIYLLSKYFDKKVGAELLIHNVDFARKNDQSGLWLVTWVGNSRAIRFYTKAGFNIIGSYNFHVTANTSNLNHLMYLKF